MSSATLRWTVLALCVNAVACRPQNLTPALPPDVRVDTYQQQSASFIDVLWVVDNSGSMAPRQENLARNFQSFIDLFSRGAIDFRLAVTTTDIFKDRGQFRGNPKVLAPTTPGLPTAFAANIKVGTNGSPYEAGLEAAQLAINGQKAKNDPILTTRLTCQGKCTAENRDACIADCLKKNPIEFLRPEAYLYIIFVTDEEDESAEDVRYFWRSYETAKGIGNDGTVTTAAIMGDVPTNSCGATPGNRYKALSDLTGGEVGSICDTDFNTTLKKLATNAVGLRRKFALSIPPNAQTIKVTLKYPCNTPDTDLTNCASVDRTFCEEQPADSQSLACTPPQGGPDGWAWEEDTNLIFFAGDSVPGFKAMVEIQYYEEGKEP